MHASMRYFNLQKPASMQAYEAYEAYESKMHACMHRYLTYEACKHPSI